MENETTLGDQAFFEKQLGTSIDYIDVETWTLNPTERYVNWNYLPRLFGIQKGLSQKAAIALMDSCSERKASDCVEEVIQGTLEGQLYEASFWIRRVDNGRRRLLRIRAKRSYTNDNQQKIIGMTWDDTDQFLRSERSNQQESLSLLGQMAGSVAHDLINYFSVIQTCTDLSQHKYKDSASHLLEMHDRIASTVSVASGIVNSLLSFSKAVKIESTKVDVNDFLISFEPIARVFTGPDTDLNISIDPNVKSGFFDKTSVHNSLMNLISNSVDAAVNSRKNKIDIIAKDARSLDSQKAHRETVTDIEDFIVLQVSDNGKGMSEDVSTKIFDPFFTTKPEDKGTGLGPMPFT